MKARLRELDFSNAARGSQVLLYHFKSTALVYLVLLSAKIWWIYSLFCSVSTYIESGFKGIDQNAEGNLPMLICQLLTHWMKNPHFERGIELPTFLCWQFCIQYLSLYSTPLRGGFRLWNSYFSMHDDLSLEGLSTVIDFCILYFFTHLLFLLQLS